MPAPRVRNEAIDSNKNSRKRRKKRRTEDFSSDSSESSASSSSDQNEDYNDDDFSTTYSATTKQTNADLNVDSENEEERQEGTDHDKASEVATMPITNEVRKSLAEIRPNFDTIEKNSKNNANFNIREAEANISKESEELEKKYLTLMTSTFADDVDELRKKPDFTSNSLVILAKALQSGSNMFDEQTLNEILK